jgi:hypothetical protein
MFLIHLYICVYYIYSTFPESYFFNGSKSEEVEKVHTLNVEGLITQVLFSSGVKMEREDETTQPPEQLAISAPAESG